jgi:hypothetical protein
MPLTARRSHRSVLTLFTLLTLSAAVSGCGCSFDGFSFDGFGDDSGSYDTAKTPDTAGADTFTFDDAPVVCNDFQEEVSAYAYDADGNLRQIKRTRMNGDIDTTTYANGRIVHRAIETGEAKPLVELSWSYTDDRLTEIRIIDRSDSPRPDALWAMTFSYDDAGQLAELRGDGIFPFQLQLLQELISESHNIGRLAAEPAVAEVTLYAPIDADLFLSLFVLNEAPVLFIARYTYDAEGRFARSTWDINADGTLDYAREDRDDAQTHSSLAFSAPNLDSSPYITIERDLDAQGQLTERRIFRGGALSSTQRWSQEPITDVNGCAVTDTILDQRDWDADGSIDETLTKQYDAQDRLIYDALTNSEGVITDRTFTTHLLDGRLEERDRNSDGKIDQTTRYTYDADGRLLQVTISEIDLVFYTSCDPFGPWRAEMTCTP